MRKTTVRDWVVGGMIVGLLGTISYVFLFAFLLGTLVLAQFVPVFHNVWAYVGMGFVGWLAGAWWELHGIRH